MDNRTVIIVLAIILFILIILNHVKVVKVDDSTSSSSSSSQQGNCSQTVFGCCPDGVNSKSNFYGTNCPPYRPPPGYQPMP